MSSIHLQINHQIDPTSLNVFQLRMSRNLLCLIIGMLLKNCFLSNPWMKTGLKGLYINYV